MLLDGNIYRVTVTDNFLSVKAELMSRKFLGKLGTLFKGKVSLLNKPDNSKNRSVIRLICASKWPVVSLTKINQGRPYY